MALVLRGGTLIDGSGGEPVSDAVVVIEEERISRVGQRAQFPAPSEVLERDGLTLLPGPLLPQTGGHGDHGPSFLDAHHYAYQGVPGLVQTNVTCDGPDQVRLAARRAFRHGATQIKVCVSGGAVSFTDKLEDAQFSVPELRAAVEEAEARGTYVTAHAHNVRGIANGIEAGV